MPSRALRRKGLKLLAQARAETGLPVVTEVLNPRDVELVAEYADMLQIGARNMQNFILLREVGRAKRPVLLKRGLAATAEEWLMAAEYILSEGNYEVVLCERGIRTYETSTRNTLDISAIPTIKRLSHLPILVDPSHGTGKRALVAPLARAAMAAGADGVIVEVHPSPETALSDGPQSLTFDDFRQMMDGPASGGGRGRPGDVGADAARRPRRPGPDRRIARLGPGGQRPFRGSRRLRSRARRRRRRPCGPGRSPVSRAELTVSSRRGGDHRGRAGQGGRTDRPALLPVLRPGTIVTDIASTKGGDRRGPDPARAGRGLLRRRPSVRRLGAGRSGRGRRLPLRERRLCPDHGARRRRIGSARNCRPSLGCTGARFLHLTPAEHDLIAAGVSHLPHLVAAALVKTAAALEAAHPGSLDPGGRRFPRHHADRRRRPRALDGDSDDQPLPGPARPAPFSGGNWRASSGN